ncbi:MAG TPA: hypothetical protein VFJ74_02520 [Gemmatimonadaceae bacterium]|nr:hypothetical protein [Gemmatimonadaceae bacterium]
MYQHESQVEVAFDGRVPPEVQQSVFERLVATEAADARRGARVQRRVDAIAEDYRVHLREKLGERKYAGLRDYRNEMRRAHAEHRGSSSSSTDERASAEQTAARARRRGQTLATLERLGIRAADLTRLAARARRRIARLVPKREDEAAADGSDVGRLLRARDVPATVREGRKSPFTIVTPPYVAKGTWTDGWTTDEVHYSRTDHLDVATGLVGSKVNLDDPDASDFGFGWKERHTRLGFWYQMPATGLVDLWLEAQSGLSRHALRLYDEWGVSSASVYQVAYLTMQTVVGGKAETRRTTEVSSFGKDDETDGHWDVESLVDGHSYWTHFFSSTPHKPGTWIWIRVGAVSYNHVITNDVEVHSAIDFRWFLKSVQVGTS